MATCVARLISRALSHRRRLAPTLSASIITIVAVGTSVPAQAQTSDLPDPVAGEVIYVETVDDVGVDLGIAIDGELGDWAAIPSTVVDSGPTPPSDPAENGSVTWSTVADATALYVSATMPDATIIAGAHGADYWNEDSIEVYVNLGDDVDAASYSPDVAQIRFTPVDIGNTDAAGLTLTGTNAAAFGVEGFVVATNNGWGFEAKVDWPDGYSPVHGRNFGFQLHANGASTGDRDTKLIWSNIDTTDSSYQNPSFFGTAVLFDTSDGSPVEAVERTVAQPSANISRGINVNQHGYIVGREKVAIFGNPSRSPVAWSVIDAMGIVVAFGDTEFQGNDTKTGELVHSADFTELDTAGEGYRLRVAGARSLPFDISTDLYDQLAADSLHYFYQTRSGIELTAELAGEAYARPAGHLSDDGVTCFAGADETGQEWPGCDYTLDAAGGWYDAGDYGKYIVPAAIATWTLLNAYESNPVSWSDGSNMGTAIPETGNGVADILDEARWEIEWFLSMQVPEGEPQAGMVHHKLHDEEWAGLPLLPATESPQPRSLMPPSTQATLDAAAIAAQCARIWADIDADFAERCGTAAVSMWDAALANPAVFTGLVPGVGGGPYDDTDPADEFAWAGTELFITTGDDRFLEPIEGTPQYLNVPLDSAPMWWGDVQALGPMSVVAAADSPSVDLPDEMVATSSERVIAAADWALASQSTVTEYRIPLIAFDWGSNSAVLNNTVAWGMAHQLTGDEKYVSAMIDAYDYLLGRNPLNQSFISGYGDDTLEHPHHRHWANTPDPDDEFPPPPPGVVAGGPNSEPSDPVAEELVADLPVALRYIDDVESYSTNEVAINWNAPLVWSSNYLVDVLGGGPSTESGEADASGEADQAAEADTAVEPAAEPVEAVEATEDSGSRLVIVMVLVALTVFLALAVVGALSRRRPEAARHQT